MGFVMTEVFKSTYYCWVQRSSCGKWWWWIRRKWQLHILSGSGINAVSVPHWLLSQGLPWDRRQREWAVKKKAWSSCLSHSGCLLYLSHSDLCLSVMFHRPCKTLKHAPTLWKSPQSHSDTWAKSLAIFLDYCSPRAICCQILLILSLKSLLNSFS